MVDETQDPSGSTDDRLFARLGNVNNAWRAARLKRRRSKGQIFREYDEGYFIDNNITSGWNWDTYDEGQNVSGDMLNKSNRTKPDSGNTDFDFVTIKQWILRASFEDDKDVPIAYLILEKRKKKEGGLVYLCVRWLIGHPEKSGGGGKVMDRAISIFNEQRKEADGTQVMVVDSAYSAVDWYVNKGFRTVEYPNVVKHVGYSDTTLEYGGK